MEKMLISFKLFNGQLPIFIVIVFIAGQLIGYCTKEAISICLNIPENKSHRFQFVIELFEVFHKN